MTLLRKACPLSHSTSTQAFTDCFIVLFIEPKDTLHFKVNTKRSVQMFFLTVAPQIKLLCMPFIFLSNNTDTTKTVLVAPDIYFN